MGIAWCIAVLPLLGPVLADPARVFWATEGADATGLIWTLWFVADSLLGEGALALHTPLIGFPDGGALWPATPIEAVLLAPITHAWGPVAAFNLAQIAHVGLAGAAMYALGTRLSGSRAVGLAVSPALALAPVLLTSAHNGNVEIGQVYWVALAGLAALVAAERGGWGRAALAGAVVGLAVIANIYIGVAAAVAALALAAFGRRWPWSTWGTLTGFALLVAVPPMLLAASTLVGEDAIVMKSPQVVLHMRLMEGSASLLHFFVPLPALSRTPLGKIGPFINGYAPGLVLLSVAVWGLWRRRVDAKDWALLGLIAAGVLLAMGPVLLIWQDAVTLGGRLVPLPFLVLDQLPPFDRMIELWRFGLLVQLGVGLLAARALVGRSPRWLALFGGLVVVEALGWNPGLQAWHTTASPAPTAAEVLLDLPEPGAVVDIPANQHLDPLYFQTLHGQPVSASTDHIGDARVLELVGGPPWTLVELREVSRTIGYRWLVVHTRDGLEARQPVHDIARALTEAGLVVRSSPDLILVDLNADGPWPEQTFRRPAAASEPGKK